MSETLTAPSRAKPQFSFQLTFRLSNGKKHKRSLLVEALSLSHAQEKIRIFVIEQAKNNITCLYDVRSIDEVIEVRI